jgi:DNA repair protein RadC
MSDRNYHIREYGVQVLREQPLASNLTVMDDPALVADYWRTHIASHPHHNRDVEHLFVLLVNTRRRPTGHYLVADGINDQVLTHPREVFRVAIMHSASALILMHNHPSGDPMPSNGDIKMTRHIAKAGKLLGIELVDHVIIGDTTVSLKGYSSMREFNYIE